MKLVIKQILKKGCIKLQENICFFWWKQLEIMDGSWEPPVTQNL